MDIKRFPTRNEPTALYLRVPGFPGYYIMRNGSIYSTETNWRGRGVRKMQAIPNKYGYLRIRLTRRKKRFNRYVHKLMALCFLPPRPSPQHEIRHLNGVKVDNNATNLKWGTSQENADDREKHGKTSRGIQHSIAIRKGLER